MAFIHGKKTYFAIDNNAGTLTNISTYLNNVDFPRDADVPETTTFDPTGATCDRTYIAGLRNATISVSGFFDPASSAVDEILEDILTGTNYETSKTFSYGPEDNTMGNVEYTGECFMTSYSTSSPVDGVTSFTADFQVTGAITRGTYS